MDELRIRSIFLKRLICKFINKKLKKATGCDITTELTKFEIESTDNGKYKFYVGLNGEIERRELELLITKLLK